MKYLGQFWKYRAQFGLVLILVLPVTTQSQISVWNDAPDAAQLAKIIEQIQSRQLDARQMSLVRAIGFRLISVSRYKDSKSIFMAILAVAPRDQEALYGAALASFNLKELSSAEELARRATESAEAATLTHKADINSVRSRHSDSLVLLAVILAVRGDNAGSLKAVRNAVELAPESFDAQFAFGRALYGAGDLSGAADVFRKAITLKPEDFQARFFLATALEGAGDYPQAREAYAELIRIQPQHAEGHLGLGVLLLKQETNKAEEGIRELLKAVEIKGDLYEARIALGRALIKVGRPAEAIAHLDHAAMLAPGNPEPYYQLAIAYRRLGHTAGAERASAKVKEINSSRRKRADTSNLRPGPQN